jgi:uncharacterized protein YecT (DUF1311 family)
MIRSLPPVQSFSLVVRHCFALLAAVSANPLTSAAAQAQELDDGGEDVLILSIACGNEYYDTPRISECLGRQNAKVDRWLQAAIESYARWATKEMEARRGYGGNPPDLVAQLQESQAAFDTYRRESAELVRQSIDGSIAPLEQSRTYFELTVDRARFLIANCYGRFMRKPSDRVDLTTADWCSTGPE